MKKEQAVMEIGKAMILNSWNPTEAEKKKTKLYKQVLSNWENKNTGKKGAQEARELFVAKLIQIATCTDQKNIRNYRTHEERKLSWKKQRAFKLADKAGKFYNEHGSVSGDYKSTGFIDFVPEWEAAKAPYLDMGGEGLALVSVKRKRVYTRSYKGGPSYNSTTYLVGKNETGTYFAHPVPKNIGSVREAIKWIWNGQEEKIIARQGDIALIEGLGPKMPTLPIGYQVLEGEWIMHDTSPRISYPGKGQRIIVSRRAIAQVW